MHAKQLDMVTTDPPMAWEVKKCKISLVRAEGGILPFSARGRNGWLSGWVQCVRDF